MRARSSPRRGRRARGRSNTQDRDAARDLERAEAKLEELAADHARGLITKREWFAARDVLQDEIAAACRHLDTHVEGPLKDLPGSQKALRDAWDANTVEWRRAVLDAVVDEVIVKPSRPTRSFDPDRISIAWRA